MNNDPYIIFQNNKFLIVYKPPFWKMDININYELFSDDKQKEELKKEIKPFQLYIKYLLLDNFNIKPNDKTYNICQRYDEETSGGIVVALEKPEKYMKILLNNMFSKKIFLVLVNGKLKEKNGYIYKYIDCNNFKQYKKCEILDNEYYSNKKNINSISYYDVIGYYKIKHKVYTLLHIRIFTSKTHQIRLHMKSLGHPIVSDNKYNDIDIFTKNKKIISRIFIHNIFLSFKDDNFPNNFTIPITNDIFKVLNNVDKKKIYKDIYDIHNLLDLKI
jgi:23S rRNA-/tRNA-specific pseudouridylate synthase